MRKLNEQGSLHTVRKEAVNETKTEKSAGYYPGQLAIMLLVPAMCADAFNFTPTSGYDDDGKAIPLELYSEAVYMVNLDSGEAIVDINGEDERVPASLTKIMTAVVFWINSKVMNRN